MNPLVAPEAHARPHRTALSVNVNKMALLRNTRHLGIPERGEAVAPGAGGRRPGHHRAPAARRRHIRTQDVHDLHALLQQWPEAEYNIEGNPFHNLMGFVRALRPHQVTFVPDSEDQFTSDHGWRFRDDAARLQPLIDEARALGVRVSLFMDPLPDADAAGARHRRRAGGALHRGLCRCPWHAAKGRPPCWPATPRRREAALAQGLGVNAGHDLNRDNLTDFLRAVPGVLEVSIGHALIADALELGLTRDRARLPALHPAAPLRGAADAIAA
jgi:pyridoxine 5-phosphate synthase